MKPHNIPVTDEPQAFRPGPNLLHWDEYVSDVQNRTLTDEDGWAYFANETHYDDTHIISPSDFVDGVVRPHWAQWVVWYQL